MTTREKRDVNPLLVKFGVALAVSFAGFLFYRLGIKKSKPSLPPPLPHSQDHGNEANFIRRAQSRDNLHALKKTSRSNNNLLPAGQKHHEETYMPRVNVESPMAGISPNSRHSSEKDGFLLPEFDDLIKEFDFSAASTSFSPKTYAETPRSHVETLRAFRKTEKDDYEEEIQQLRSMVRNLQERERNLEVQLLEYYGLKEQETAMIELQNKVNISNMEAKFFTMTIESLKAENQRLQTELGKVVSELDAGRTKIKMLKKKLRSEAEQNKEQILAIRKRVSRLPDHNHKAGVIDQDIQLKLHRLKGLETEVDELKKSNVRLQIENSDLTRRLESTQIIANSVLEDPETEELRKTSIRLREQNEELTKEVERLNTSRCSDVEELVYLKWINACFRYEVRNYQPLPGKTAARDLSKTLSPKSEKKAKQMILEYANTEGVNENVISFSDFDSDQGSSSQASYQTDSGDFDDSSVDHLHTSSTKHKYIAKLRKLLLGKDENAHHHNPRRSSGDNVSPRSSSTRKSLDLERLRGTKADTENIQRSSDVGSSVRLGSDDSYDMGAENQHYRSSDSDKSDLFKFAEVLKNSHSPHKKSSSSFTFS